MGDIDKRNFLLHFYFDKHPLLKCDSFLKISYMAFLEKSFLENKEKDNKFSDNLIKLYKKYFVLSSESVKFSEIFNLSFDDIIKNFRNTSIGPKYLFALILIDNLFINNFFDQDKGKKILEYVKKMAQKVIKSFSESMFDNLFTAFYAFEKTDEFEKTYSKLLDIYNVIWENRKFLKLPVERIIFTGNMSAGKSTLLNAIIGKKVSKAQNEACTSENRYISDKVQDGFNSIWSDSIIDLDVSNNDLLNYTDDKEVHIATNFRKIVANKESRFVFIDTPGVNSSVNEEHREITHRAIEKETDIMADLAQCSSMEDFINSIPYKRMIYIFDAGNIGRDADVIHLKYIKEHYSNYAGGVMFLVNRVDDFNSKDDSIEDTLKAVKSDLEKMGFLPQQCANVFPISAYAGYLAKKKICGYELTEEEQDTWDIYVRKFKKDYFQFDRFWDNSNNLSNYISNIKDEEIIRVLLHSGLLNIEDSIFNPNIWKRLNETFQQTSFVFQEMQKMEEEQKKLFDKLDVALDEFKKEIEEVDRKNFNSVEERIEKFVKTLTDEPMFASMAPKHIKDKIVAISSLLIDKLTKFEEEERVVENELDKFLVKVNNLSTPDEYMEFMSKSKVFFEKIASENILNDKIREKILLISSILEEKLSRLQELNEERERKEREIENKLDRLIRNINCALTPDELLNILQSNESFLKKISNDGIVNDAIIEKLNSIPVKAQLRINKLIGNML